MLERAEVALTISQAPERIVRLILGERSAVVIADLYLILCAYRHRAVRAVSAVEVICSSHTDLDLPFVIWTASCVGRCLAVFC